MLSHRSLCHRQLSLQRCPKRLRRVCASLGKKDQAKSTPLEMRLQRCPGRPPRMLQHRRQGARKAPPPQHLRGREVAGEMEVESLSMQPGMLRMARIGQGGHQRGSVRHQGRLQPHPQLR